MDTATAPALEPVEAARPRFDLRDIPQATRVLAEGIEDLNADALDAICPGCKATLSWGQWLNASFNRNRQISCHACSLPISVKDLTKEPIPAHRLEEVQATGYFDRVWHHATRSEHWAEEAMEAEQSQLLIHAGSELAALSLANDLRRDYQRGTEPIFIHSFTLSDTGALSTVIVEDTMDDWPERLDGAGHHALPICSSESTASRQKAPVAQSYEEQVAGYREEDYLYLRGGLRGVPYYNRYELPGDISLLIHAGLIDLSSVATVEM